jgi:hypothetical protein
MERISKILAPRAACLELVTAGLIPSAMFFYFRLGIGKDEAVDDIFPYYDMDDDDIESDRMVPAWTKEELDEMIGPLARKPEMMNHDDNAGTENGWANPFWNVDFPDKSKTYKRGAEASAALLLWLIKERGADVKKINERYTRRFIQ